MPGRPFGAEATPSSPPLARDERPSLESSLEISSTMLVAGLGAAVVIFFGLVYVFFL